MPSSEKPYRIVFATEASEPPRTAGGQYASQPTTPTGSTPQEIQSAEKERQVLGYLQQLSKVEREGAPEQPTVGGGEFGTWVETSPEGEPLGQSKAAKDWRRRQAEEEEQRAALASFASQFPQPVSSAPKVSTEPVSSTPKISTEPVKAPMPSVKPEPVPPPDRRWRNLKTPVPNQPILRDTEHNREIQARELDRKRQEVRHDFPSAEEAEKRGITDDALLGIIASNTKEISDTEKREELDRQDKPESMTLKDRALEAWLQVLKDTGSPKDELIASGEDLLDTPPPIEGGQETEEGGDSKSKEVKPISFGAGPIVAQIARQAGAMAMKGGRAGMAGKAALGIIGLGLAAVATAKILHRLNGFLANAAEEIKVFSPEIMMAQVDRSLMVLSKRMERAQEVGPMLAKREKAATALQAAMEDLKTDFIKVTTPFMTSVLEGLARIAVDSRGFFDGQSKQWLTQKEAWLSFYYNAFVPATDEELGILRGIRKKIRDIEMEQKLKDSDQMPNMDRVLTLLSGWEQGQFGNAPAARPGQANFAQGGPRLPNFHQPTRPANP